MTLTSFMYRIMPRLPPNESTCARSIAGAAAQAGVRMTNAGQRWLALPQRRGAAVWRPTHLVEGHAGDGECLHAAGLVGHGQCGFGAPREGAQVQGKSVGVHGAARERAACRVGGAACQLGRAGGGWCARKHCRTAARLVVAGAVLGGQGRACVQRMSWWVQSGAPWGQCVVAADHDSPLPATPATHLRSRPP
jgi:hypothetical protein